MELSGGWLDAVKFILVFVLIVAILVLLMRRFSIGSLSATGPRSRQPRLAVIDTTPVDVRRRLVLIKRDNVEHLLMIGGPTDIVVEANISRAGAAAREPRPIPDVVRPDAARPAAAAAETPEWSLPLEPMGRPARTVDLDAALPEPPARTAREAMVDSMRAVRSGAAARRGPAADLDMPPEEVAAPALTPAAAMEINHRPVPMPEPRRAPSPPEPQRPPPSAPEPSPPSGEAAPEPKRGVPAPPRPVPPLQPAPAPPSGGPPPPPPPPRPVQPAAANGGAAQPPRPAQSAPAAAPAAPPSRQAQSADENSLAEMAQRLEAALRRPTKQPAEAPSARVQGRPEPPAGRKPVNGDAAGPVKTAVKPVDSPAPDLKVLQGKGKNEPTMESLEDEMAKMLGRSPGKS